MTQLWNKVKAAYVRAVGRCGASTTAAPAATTQHMQSPFGARRSQENAIPKMSKSEQRPAGEAALRLICKWEGFRAAPYLCSANVWTIGYGTTIYPDGTRVSERDPEISEAQAKKFLKDHLARRIEPDLTELVGDIVNQNQYDALVSFIYNVGMGPKKWKSGDPEGFRQSTMLKKILARDFAGAAAEFPRWNKAKGKVIAGLIARRKEERTLFETDPWA